MNISPSKRMTRQRSVILASLQASYDHPTADELYELVKKQLPNVSLGTIYRNLDVLCRSGTARKIEVPHGQSRYEGNISPHHHVRCKECGKLGDVFDYEPEVPCIAGEHTGGFKVTGVILEFEGVCPDCQSTIADAPVE